MPRGYAPSRVDANQKALTELWRKMGVTVLILSGVGHGSPDLLLGVDGVNVLVELKNGKLPLSAQKLTELEQKFFDEWKGQVCIVRNETDAIGIIGAVRRQNDLIKMLQRERDGGGNA
jgi:hypothetical protein